MNQDAAQEKNSQNNSIGVLLLKITLLVCLLNLMRVQSQLWNQGKALSWTHRAPWPGTQHPPAPRASAQGWILSLNKGKSQTQVRLPKQVKFYFLPQKLYLHVLNFDMAAQLLLTLPFSLWGKFITTITALTQEVKEKPLLSSHQVSKSVLVIHNWR